MKIENEYSFRVEEVIEKIKSTFSGLSETEAQKRLVEFGYNEITEKKKESLLKMFFSQFKNFLIYILIGAVVVSLFLGEWADSIVIGLVLILNAVLGFLQEFKAGKSIEALKKMSGLKARVLRDGHVKRTSVRDLVIGDVILIETGEKIPADARIIESINLQVNESALTGESVPVFKFSEKIDGEVSLADRKNMLFSGTIVVAGRGKAVITKTGMDTQIGKIAGLIQETGSEPTPLQEKLEILAKWLGWFILVICVIVAFAGIIQGGKVFEMILVGISLAVAAIPEGLSAIVTICLALGSNNMVKRHALVRKLPLVETLGCVTVICSDKTGTLTCNEMTVRKIYCNNKEVDVTGTGYKTEGEFLYSGKSFNAGEFELLFKIGALNNTAILKGENLVGDPTEAALLVSAKKSGFDYIELHKNYPILGEAGFDSVRKMMSTLHNIDGKNLFFSKGAPETILGKCNFIYENGNKRPITDQDKKQILQKNLEFANQALRVLGFACKEIINSGKDLETEEKDLVFVGLQAMIDPPRAQVKSAIAECKAAGIKVVMITGDYLPTAIAVAKEIGLVGRAMTGNELDSGVELESIVEDVVIYARVNPEHKIKIVDALKKKGHIVAMTGDGVNDAPALKRSDIGISMGIVGTDVAREASGMVLTDDNFASIVSAVEEGRVIFDNIKKTVNYLLSCNFSEVLILFLAMLIGFKTDSIGIIVPLTAIQILWMNLVTDGLPALALSLDPAEKNIMQRPPRNPKEKIISKDTALTILVFGVLFTAGTLLLFSHCLKVYSVDEARTIVFTAVVFFEIIGIMMFRPNYKSGIFSNLYLLFAMLSSLALQAMVIYVPFFNGIFKTVPLGLNPLIKIVGMGIVLYIAAGTALIFIRKLPQAK